MNNGKGKGRAGNLDDSNRPSIDDQSPHSSSSIIERVTASATGLAHSAFAAPTSNELSDAASAALTSTGKGRQLGGSSGSLAESSRANQQTGLPTSQGQSLPSIRAGYREEHIRDAESEFSSFLDGIDSFTPSSESYSHADPSLGQALDIPLDRANGRTDTHGDQAGQIWYNTVHEQQQHDGDAVLSILSHPSAMTNELEDLPVEEEVLNWDLTDQQISRLRTLVDEIFPPPDQHISMSAEHRLNLIPNMVSTPAPSDPVLFNDTTLEESYIYFGDVPRNRARQMWMEQWEGVLTRYTDEVWGNLLPLIVEAREEIKAIKEDRPETTIDQSKALRRLRLVLDHVRKLETR
jgi:hypothetical protein